MEYIALKRGLAVPLPALQLAWHLEHRGFTLAVGGDQRALSIQPIDRLTQEDNAGIERWRLHLAAIVTYEAPELS